LLVCFPRTAEFNKVDAKNQYRLLLLQCRQSGFDPSSDGALCNAKRSRGLFNGVGAVDLNASPIWPSGSRFCAHNEHT
jgi:hypothetical protein